jgi:hypothetical protein
VRYSGNTDPDLADWLRWASESGHLPNFIRAIAETSLADLPNYSMLSRCCETEKAERFEISPSGAVMGTWLVGM